MSIRPDLNGLRMQLPGHPAVYLIVDGMKRGIPDPATYNNLFRDWNNIIQDPHLNDITDGGPITQGAVLARGINKGTVFLITNGQKHGIPSEAVMDKYHFAWDKIQDVAPILIDSIPTGNQIR